MWDEATRKRNVKDYGLDFAGCDAIWDHFTVTGEDSRQAYGEARQVCFGLLTGEVVARLFMRDKYLSSVQWGQRTIWECPDFCVRGEKDLSTQLCGGG